MEHKFTAANFEKEVLDAEIPVLVDFYADWCGPCKMMAPVVTQLAEEYEGRAVVGKVNTDEEQELAIRYRVMNIPTVLFFKDGREIERRVGVMPPDAFVQILEENL